MRKIPRISSALDLSYEFFKNRSTKHLVRGFHAGKKLANHNARKYVIKLVRGFFGKHFTRDSSADDQTMAENNTPSVS